MATGWLAQHYRNQRDDLAAFVIYNGMITKADVDEYNRKHNKN